jgi:hypothetical protein
LLNLALNTLSKNTISGTYDIKGIAKCEDDIYLTSIRNIFPCLSPQFTILRYKQNQGLPVHIDKARNCTLNIPLANCENTITTFYENIDSREYDISDHPAGKSGNIIVIKNKLDEVFNFTMITPVLFNTSIPHSVMNYGEKERIMLTWPLTLNYMFETAIDIFNDDAASALTPLKHSLNSSVHS